MLGFPHINAQVIGARTANEIKNKSRVKKPIIREKFCFYFIKQYVKSRSLYIGTKLQTALHDRNNTKGVGKKISRGTEKDRKIALLSLFQRGQ